MNSQPIERPTVGRAYSVLQIKSVDEERRIIEGVATTPTPDMMGDIIEPKGAEFSLPLPLLYQHNARQPIGHVIAAKVTDAGISITAQIAKGVVPFIDEAWALIKEGLIRGLSIGFSELESARIKDTYSFHVLKWKWLELSAVTIPANQEASIQTVKSADLSSLRAASGALQRPVVRLAITPGATGSPVTTKGANMATKSTAERLGAFEAKHAAIVASMDAIMQKADDDGGRTLDESEAQEYEGLKAERSATIEHICRLKEHEAAMVQKAVAVTEKTAGDPDTATRTRQGVVVMGKSNLPGHIPFTRYAMAIAKSGGNLMQAAELAKQWKDSTPEVEICLKAAVAAGTTTDASWAAPLVVYQNMASEFIEWLRPATLIGRMPGLRRVPFNVSMARTTAGSTSQWVGEGAPKPLSRMSFETITLGHTKIATIIVLTEETVRFSNPAAEALVAADMRAAIVQYSDAQFIDPTVTVSGTTRPASITNGATTYTISGTTIAAITTDVAKLFAAFTTANIDLAGAMFVMHPRTAMYLSMLRTTQDIFAFPGLGINGGTFFGVPVITSNSVPIDTGADSYIVLVSQDNILLADDGGITLDMSREASLVMDSAPTNPATSTVSLWQSNLVGLRAERFINYRRRRDAGVAYLNGVSY